MVEKGDPASTRIIPVGFLSSGWYGSSLVISCSSDGIKDSILDDQLLLDESQE